MSLRHPVSTDTNMPPSDNASEMKGLRKTEVTLQLCHGRHVTLVSHLCCSVMQCEVWCSGESQWIRDVVSRR